MSMEPGTYRFGPKNASLTVSTTRKGAASKAGHDLLLEVTAWSATLELGDAAASTELSLTADSSSLRVREGTGGIQLLDDDARAGIVQTIDEEVLKGAPIEFRSTTVELGGDGAPHIVTGELELAGGRHPIGFQLETQDNGRLTGRATVKQTDWGMKPYTALFGTLKVADEVEIAVETEPHAG
jgi:polyisoprenoid-binding protein YceI